LYATNNFGLTVFSTNATGTIVSTPDVVDVEVSGYEETKSDSMIISAVSILFPLLGPIASTGRRRGGEVVVSAPPISLPTMGMATQRVSVPGRMRCTLGEQGKQGGGLTRSECVNKATTRDNAARTHKKLESVIAAKPCTR